MYFTVQVSNFFLFQHLMVGIDSVENSGMRSADVEGVTSDLEQLIP